MLKRSWKSCTILLLMCVLVEQLSAQSPELLKGSIRGQVVDETTQSPLPAVNIIIEGSNLGTAADAEGRFIIQNVSAGIHNLKFMMIG